MVTGDQPATAAAIGANLGIKQEGTTGACAAAAAIACRILADQHPDALERFERFPNALQQPRKCENTANISRTP